MSKLLYSSPDVTCLEIMAGAPLAASNEPNAISSLELYELTEE